MIERREVQKDRRFSGCRSPGEAVSAVPAPLPDCDRAIRPRRLRPGDQHQPLRRQVGGGARAAPATCAIASRHMRYAWDQFDAYFGPERVGEVAVPSAYAAARAGRPGPLGPRTPRAAYTAISLSLNMLRGGSRCTIIVSRPLCIRPVDTEFYTPRLGRRRPYIIVVVSGHTEFYAPDPPAISRSRVSHIFWSCRRSCLTSASISR